MGIDLEAGGRRVGHKNRTSPKSKNPYLLLLVKVRSCAPTATAPRPRLRPSTATTDPVSHDLPLVATAAFAAAV